MNPDEYESINTDSMAIHLSAGAMAGFMEFLVMFPIDTVKTRMQSISFKGSSNIFKVLMKMVKTEGIFSPIRGMSAVAVAAGPAHALYFSSYEFFKENTRRVVRLHDSFYHGIAGSTATLFHDAVMNPSEVVKQRMQMKNSPCRTALECARNIYRSEGLTAFYRSYGTTLIMNVPFQCVHFMTYELCQQYLNKERTYNPKTHVVSGGVAGGLAAAVTNPLDVCKTLLNTQEGQRTVGLFKAASTIYKSKGLLGFSSGMSARVAYTVPSTAICWSTYEFFKFILKEQDAKKGANYVPIANTK
ncbi:unnamed protein product [Phyllotreta striolata]|uniref:Mitochondrial carrier protein n=1 Tax=Phyllotreta striolata TaxID=444603 RepID=A0A9P0GUX2_PHYSR|nr:unnamed protein product [Phyllotreta striolata]